MRVAPMSVSVPALGGMGRISTILAVAGAEYANNAAAAAPTRSCRIMTGPPKLALSPLGRSGTYITYVNLRRDRHGDRGPGNSGEIHNQIVTIRPSKSPSRIGKAWHGSHCSQ